MSPEQTYDPKQVTFLSDIYSFGKTLNFIITRGNPMNRPSPELQKVIKKCAEEHPDDRYQSWDDVLVDVNALYNTATLTIETDLACQVIIDGIIYTEMNDGESAEIKLNAGSHILQFVSTQNRNDKVTEQKMLRANTMQLIRVGLLSVRNKRLEEESKQGEAITKYINTSPNSPASIATNPNTSSKSKSKFWPLAIICFILINIICIATDSSAYNNEVFFLLGGIGIISAIIAVILDIIIEAIFK